MKLLPSSFFAIAAMIGSMAFAQQVPLGGASPLETVAKLRAGQFVWAPQVAPEGPMLVIVDLATQRAVVFRNGVPFAATTVSTGRAGRETPTGIFTVLQKEVVHHSKTYDNAPMPFMQRLTWKGIALHAGNLPGYPASHGCVRLPAKFAQLLYGETNLGMTVVITDRAAPLLIAPTPDLATSGVPEASASTGSFEWTPDKSPTGPVSVVVSAADKRAVVLRNGVIIGSSHVTIDGPVSGAWAYAMRNRDAAGDHWSRVQLSSTKGGKQSVSPAEFERFHVPEDFRRNVRSILSPGATIIVTADSLRSGSMAQPLTVIETDPETH
jgi:Uncharacterized protein conserved in bacteria